MIDLLIPLPAVVGVLLAAGLLWKMGGQGGVWLWGGGLVCAAMTAVFVKVLMS